MRNISIIALIMSLFVSAFAVAAEVNIFNARHYKADAEMYEKFTAATGIKKLADKIPGGCGCDKRKNWLNNNFPYNMNKK